MSASVSSATSTIEGKEISSRNSTTHGLWRTDRGTVLAGPFAEDPDAVDEFVADVVRGLRPRDDLEEPLAIDIARLLLDLERANAYKSVALEAFPPRRRGRSRDRNVTPGADVADDGGEGEPSPSDANRAMEILENALRLTGKAHNQLHKAKADYDRSRSASSSPVPGTPENSTSLSIPR